MGSDSPVCATGLRRRRAGLACSGGYVRSRGGKSTRRLPLREVAHLLPNFIGITLACEGCQVKGLRSFALLQRRGTMRPSGLCCQMWFCQQADSTCVSCIIRLLFVPEVFRGKAAVRAASERCYAASVRKTARRCHGTPTITPPRPYHKLHQQYPESPVCYCRHLRWDVEGMYERKEEDRHADTRSGIDASWLACREADLCATPAVHAARGSSIIISRFI